MAGQDDTADQQPEGDAAEETAQPEGQEPGQV